MKPKLLITTIFSILTLGYGLTYAQNPHYKWAVNAIGKGDDRGFKIATDNYGNMILTGRYNSKEIQFGDIKLINSDRDSSTSDIFIVKYNPKGEMIWAQSMGGFGDDFGTDCSTDSKGNIILIGNYDCEKLNIGHYAFNNKTKKGEGSDIIIVKYSLDGKVIWAKSLGGAKHDGGYTTCAIDKEENIYVTGSFYSDKFWIDSLELTKSKVRGADVFLAKFSSKGKLLWAKSSHGPNAFDSESQSCSVDKQGNIIISGWFGGPYITFDSDTLKNNKEETKLFVAKYSSAGKIIWANSYNGFAATSRVDGDGNIFLAGVFADSVLSIGNVMLHNNGDGDLFITKLNPKGKVLWAKSAGGKSFDGIRNFCIDSRENAIITGSFNSPIWTIGNTILRKDSISMTTKNEDRTEDMFLASYSKSGEVLWAKCSGGKGRNVGRSCVADGKGNIYWTGSFDVAKLVLGTLTLMNSGDSDIFIIKLSENR